MRPMRLRSHNLASTVTGVRAAVSGEALKSDVEFRRKVNAKFPSPLKLADVTRPLEQDHYRVVIGIIGGPGNAVKLPFFSRVTFEEQLHATQSLRIPRGGVPHPS
jgi:uncharacterized protein (TIGR04141 family)